MAWADEVSRCEETFGPAVTIIAAPPGAPADDPQDGSRVDNLAELHAVASEFEQAEPDGDLADFLERVSLVADSDRALGDKVTHDSYGLGVVVGIEGGGANAVVGIDGTKRLLLRYSPVTKL